MTEKEIIIDGVNVSECQFLNDEGCYEIDASNCEGSLEDAITPCEENPNCYYKQLARKTEEYEKLKDTLTNVQGFIKAGVDPEQTESEETSLDAFYAAIEVIEEVLK